MFNRRAAAAAAILIGLAASTSPAQATGETVSADVAITDNGVYPVVDGQVWSRSKSAAVLGTDDFVTITYVINVDQTTTPLWLSHPNGLTIDGKAVDVAATGAISADEADAVRARASRKGVRADNRSSHDASFAKSQFATAASAVCSTDVPNPNLDMQWTPDRAEASVYTVCTGDGVASVGSASRLYKRENGVYVLKDSDNTGQTAPPDAIAHTEKSCQSSTARYWKNSGRGFAIINGALTGTPWYDTPGNQLACSDNS